MNLAKVDALLAKHDAVVAPAAAPKADARLDAALEKVKRLHEGGELSSLEGAPTGYDARLDAVLEKTKRLDDAHKS